MPQTKAQILADRQAQLDAAFINPDITDKRHLLVQLAEVQSAMSANNPASNGGTPADITAGIDGSVDIDLIKQLLTDIKLELVNSKSIADILIQDSGTTPRYFVRQDSIDQTTGLANPPTILNFDGTVPSPVPVLPLLPIKAGTSNLINEDLYTAEVAGTGYAIGDSIANVRLLNGETGLFVVSSWYNITQRSPIGSAPPIAHLKGYEDKIEELLTAILSIDTSSSTSLLNLEIELGNNGDITIPSTNLDPATLKALIRRSNDLIVAASPIDTIGSSIDLSIPANPTQPATLKALDRGIWQTLLDTIANTGDAADTTIPATVNDASTSKGIGRLVISTLLNLITTITNRSQFTRITNGSIDLTIKPTIPVGTDNAAVVSLSPNSAIVNLPPALLTDIATIKTNTDRISQFSYQTAEDAAGTVFLIKTDTSTNASTYINTTTGAVVSPGQLELSDPISNGGQVELNEYTALTTSAGNWTPNQILTRIRIGNTATGGFTSTIWQKPDGTVLSTIPVIDTDCEDTSKTLQTTATNTLDAIGASADVLIPATINDPSSGKGLLRFINNSILSRLLQGSQSLGSALAVTLARKTAVTGFTSTTSSNLNLLNPSGLGTATDVRDYNSIQITIVTAGPLAVNLQSAVDAGFTIGVATLDWQNAASNIIGTSNITLGSATTSRYVLDLTNVNYLRLNNSFILGAGAVVYYTLSQAPLINKISVINSIGVGSVATVTAVNNASFAIVGITIDITSSVIVASANSATITPSGGLSYQIEFDVTAISGADTVCNLAIQESYNSGASWRTIYTFEPITQPKGVRAYKSDLLPLTGNRIRYVQTITGTAPSITRSILRTQSNLAVPTAIGTRESGGFNILDLPIYGRTRRILANNRTAAPLFLGVYAKNTPLAAADRPINGQIYLIPANGLSLTAVADWGEHGTVLSPESVTAIVQVRLGVSSTFAQMTIPTGLGTAPNELFSLFVESV